MSHAGPVADSASSMPGTQIRRSLGRVGLLSRGEHAVGDLLHGCGVGVDVGGLDSGFVLGEPAGLLSFYRRRGGPVEVDCDRSGQRAGDLEAVQHRHDVESVRDYGFTGQEFGDAVFPDLLVWMVPSGLAGPFSWSCRRFR
jgi:hypothetical protein